MSTSTYPSSNGRESIGVGQQLVLGVALLGLLVQAVALAGRFWLDLVGDHMHLISGSTWSVPAAHLAAALPALVIGCIAAANTDRQMRKRLLVVNALFVIAHAYVMLMAAR